MLRRLLLGLVWVLITGTLQAATVYSDGVFTRDDQIALFSYYVGSDSDVTVSTTSYNQLPVGGFEAILAVWNFTTHDLLYSDSGVGRDASLTWASMGGEWYLVSLTQLGNDPITTNLDDGFQREGFPTYTGSDYGVPGESFIGVFGDHRSGHWSVAFTSSDPGFIVTPEPSTFALFAGGTAVFLYWRRRRIPA